MGRAQAWAQKAGPRLNSQQMKVRLMLAGAFLSLDHLNIPALTDNFSWKNKLGPFLKETPGLKTNIDEKARVLAQETVF